MGEFRIMGFFTHGRKTHHADTTVTMKGFDRDGICEVQINIVIEGTLDFDEHIFELDTVYLQTPRVKCIDNAPFALPKRIYKKLTSGKYDEQFHEAAWGSV